MQKRRLPALLLAGMLLCTGCGKTETESKAPEFPEPESGTGYTMSRFYFVAPEEIKQIEDAHGYEYAFCLTGEDGEEAFLGVSELPDQHMSAQAFSKMMQVDYIGQDYESVTEEEYTHGAQTGRRLTAGFPVYEQQRSLSSITLCEGDGNLFVVYAEYPNGKGAAYEELAAEIVESVQYFGAEPTTGGVIKADTFTLTYDDTWYPQIQNKNAAALASRLAKTDCEYLDYFAMNIKKTGATTTDQCMQEALQYLTQNESYTNIQFQEDTFLGLEAQSIQGQVSMGLHTAVHRWYYFEKDGKLYEALVHFCVDAEDEFMERFNALVLE